MTLTELSALVGAYLLEFYDSQVHLTLTVSPRDYERHVQSSTKFVGGKIVSNDRDLVINSSRIFAPVEVFPRSGVRVHYLDYWAPELDRVLGCKVAIKIDAADVRRVFAFVEGRWIDCRLPNEYRSLESRSVAEVIAATAAIRKARSAAKRTKRITGHEIARFIHNRGEIVRRVIEAAGTAAKNDDDRDYLRAAANDGAGSLLRNLCINHSGGDDAHEAATQPAPSAPAAQPEQPKQNQQPDEPRKKPRKPTTIKMK